MEERERGGGRREKNREKHLWQGDTFTGCHPYAQIRARIETATLVLALDQELNLRYFWEVEEADTPTTESYGQGLNPFTFQ